MDSPPKRASPAGTEDSERPLKRIKSAPEEPALYSDAVRKKLAATSRTGQACDRCKERKMRCDTDPSACQPCRQKGLRCYTTDRVTGQSRERGQSDRAENELQFLREQLAAYQQRYGPLQHVDVNGTVAQTPHDPVAGTRGSCDGAPVESTYIGWPAPGHVAPLYCGPVKGTLVDVMDGTIDIADWACEMMEDYPPDSKLIFNVSRTSISSTVMGYQRVEDPRLPSREEALRHANYFLMIMGQYVPILHGPSFVELVHRFYDHPAAVAHAERAQVVMVFAIIAHQTAVRNHQHSAEKFEESHRYLHYALGFYRDLLLDRSIASMQALTLMVVHFRNLPKPGVSWTHSHNVLVRAMELEYHRDPYKIKLPEAESDDFSREMRIRVFHSLLGICVTTGCRVGLPAPWQFQHLDVPLPKAIRDAEISRRGVAANLTGLCDFWPCIHFSKFLPLVTELHNSIMAVRKPAAEYVATVEKLNAKVIAWRQDWDESIKAETKHVNLIVATLLIDSWAAECQLYLHHPSCCTSDDPVVTERHLDICHKVSKRLLQNFHILSSRYKGVDFTWHSTLAYATAFGITLYIYQRRKAVVTVEQFEAIRNELKGWISLMAYADLVLRTGNHLQRQFFPRVNALEDEYQRLIVSSATKAPGGQDTITPANPSENANQISFERSNSTPHADLRAQRHSLPQAGATRNHIRSQSQPHLLQSPLPLQPGSSQQQWPLPYSIHPHHEGPAQGQSQSPLSPTAMHPAFSHSTVTAPTAPASVQPTPTSLASLLNDPGGLAMNYPTPPQTGSSFYLGGGDPAMAFTPSHYFEGSESLGWPLITMPPGQPP